MNDQKAEALIQAAGAHVAPRLKMADIEAQIVDELYFTAEQGYQADMRAKHPDLAEMGNGFPYATLGQITICVLILRNGHRIVGVNEGPVAPENFNAAVGRKMAREKATDQIWPLLGFQLKTLLGDALEAAANPALTDEARGAIRLALMSGDMAAIRGSLTARALIQA